MTPAKANSIRTERINGKQLSNRERRNMEQAEKLKKEGRWTLNKLWESYKDISSIKGIVHDDNRFKFHIKSALGDKQPHELSPFDVDRLRLKLQKEKKPATVKNVLELLRRIINYGIKKHLVPPIPFKIEMPKVSNLKTEDLTPEQIQALLKAINEDKHPIAGPMMKLALYTGMRRGEMFRLKWNDIDFQRGFINLMNPKGGIDQKIPINSIAREVLEALDRTSEFVFPGRNDKQRTEITKPVNEIKKKAGLPKDFRPLHGLRHSYASMLASSGKVDMYVLQKLLTHKSPTMTQRYAHLRDEALKRASNLAGELVNEAVKQAEQQVKADNVTPLR
jgi:integrase